MSCSQANVWLQLYVDGRLAPARFTALERHLQTCERCRNDLALLEMVRDTLARQELCEEPAHLAELVQCRIAEYEVSRAASASRAAWRRRQTIWRGTTVALIAVFAFALTQPATWAELTSSLSRELFDLVQLLASPGPDSVSWGVWMVGAVVVLVVMFRIVRTDTYTAWRRELAQRLPTLW